MNLRRSNNQTEFRPPIPVRNCPNLIRETPLLAAFPRLSPLLTARRIVLLPVQFQNPGNKNFSLPALSVFCSCANTIAPCLFSPASKIPCPSYGSSRFSSSPASSAARSFRSPPTLLPSCARSRSLDAIANAPTRERMQAASSFATGRGTSQGAKSSNAPSPACNSPPRLATPAHASPTPAAPSVPAREPLVHRFGLDNRPTRAAATCPSSA